MLNQETAKAARTDSGYILRAPRRMRVADAVAQYMRVRAGGRNPDDVKRRRKAEIDENRKLDLVFDTDPASDKGGSSAATKRQEPQHTDDQSEE